MTQKTLSLLTAAALGIAGAACGAMYFRNNNLPEYRILAEAADVIRQQKALPFVALDSANKAMIMTFSEQDMTSERASMLIKRLADEVSLKRRGSTTLAELGIRTNPEIEKLVTEMYLAPSRIGTGYDKADYRIVDEIADRMESIGKSCTRNRAYLAAGAGCIAGALLSLGFAASGKQD